MIRLSIIGTRGYPSTYGGYETFVRELGERLVKKNIQVRIYCHRSLFKQKPKYLNGIELIYIPTLETKSLSQPVHSLFCFIHACFSKTDVLLVVNPSNGPFGIISKLAGKPSMINTDGVEWKRPKWKGPGSIYFYCAAWLATKLYSKIITDAEAMQQIYLRNFNAPSTVIAYGGNIRYPKNAESIKQWWLEDYGYYLIVGRMIPDNNADLLIKGFIQSGSNKKLVVVGDVSYKDEYAASLKATQHPNIIFTGHIDDGELLAELYHHCFAYLHGHEFGGTNPALIKAMAYGCAILALNTSFTNEMLQNGKHGILFDKTVASVADKMQSLEQNPEIAAKMRETAREGITEKYNWDRITDAYLVEIKKLYKKKHSDQ